MAIVLIEQNGISIDRFRKEAANDAGQITYLPGLGRWEAKWTEGLFVVEDLLGTMVAMWEMGLKPTKVIAAKLGLSFIQFSEYNIEGYYRANQSRFAAVQVSDALSQARRGELLLLKDGNEMFGRVMTYRIPFVAESWRDITRHWVEKDHSLEQALNAFRTQASTEFPEEVVAAMLPMIAAIINNAIRTGNLENINYRLRFGIPDVEYSLAVEASCLGARFNWCRIFHVKAE